MDTTNVKIAESILPYLEEIAERLWAGRAAVMVGAGFSKNAGSTFPDWNQLGDLFYLKAYGKKPDSNAQKYQNVLRLAEEVEAAIGRPALDNLLRSNIPDQDFKPSGLHTELLKLQWADVFTTNYDTLLERASEQVVNRRYETVLNKEDLAYSNSPRIVKLHGSFPSERPFIITEEDYRTYPMDNAPFVNTVQQALLENTFCLIGFSGDDPNFLQWIGWIRDNLGKEKAQKIYLIGVFNLSSSKLQLLAQRGVIVVDFSLCDGIKANDHQLALKKFLYHVRENKPNALEWPYKPKLLYPDRDDKEEDQISTALKEWKKQRISYPGWLITPYENREKLWFYTKNWIYYLPENTQLSSSIAYIYELSWRLEKCLLPLDSSLIETCEKIIEEYIFEDNKKQLENKNKTPEFENHTIDHDDLKASLIGISLALLRSYRENGKNNKWKDLITKITSTENYNSLSNNQKEFIYYQKYLFNLFDLNITEARKDLERWKVGKTQSFWNTIKQSALAQMGSIKGARTLIRKSLNETRTAALQNTLNSELYSSSIESYQMFILEFIERVSQTPLETSNEKNTIEHQIKNQWNRKDNQEHFSSSDCEKPQIEFSDFNSPEEYFQDLYDNRGGNRKIEWESWLNYIRQEGSQHSKKEEDKRKEELKAIRCDPRGELRLLELKVKNSTSSNKMELIQQFEIGRLREHHYNNSYDENHLDILRLFRFIEETGMPITIGNSRFTSSSILKNLNKLTLKHPPLFHSIMFRFGNIDNIDKNLDRLTVNKSSQKNSDQIINKHITTLENHQKEIDKNNIYDRPPSVKLAQTSPETISRYCCKCSYKSKKHIVKLISKIYSSHRPQNYAKIENLTSRLMNSLSLEEQVNLIPEILNIQIPKSPTLLAKHQLINPMFFLEVSKELIAEMQSIKLPSYQVSALLENAKSGASYEREWAIGSLIKLEKLRLLDNDQVFEMVNSIWNITDKNGLPKDTGHYNFTFFKYPLPTNIPLKETIKAFKETTKEDRFYIPKTDTKNSTTFTNGDIPIFNEIIGSLEITPNIWSKKEVLSTLDRLISLWKSDNKMLNITGDEGGPFPSTAEEFRSRFYRVIDLLANFIGPQLSSEIDVETKSKINRLIEEMRSYKLPTTEAEARLIHLLPDKSETLIESIKKSLTSDKHETVVQGLQAIFNIIFNAPHSTYKENPLKPQAINLLSQFIMWTSSKPVTSALRIITHILREKPDILEDGLKYAVINRLDKLFIQTDLNLEKSDLIFDDRLEMRTTGSMTAAELYKYYKSQHSEIPNIITKWKENCSSPDEFSELRNPWMDIQFCMKSS